jgi:hypothetical protein
MNATAGRRFDKFTPALLVGSTAYLYVNLFAFPSIPFLLGGDQVYFWLNALRMLQGARIYQNFFQFTPPGTDLFYLALFELFGPRLWVPNAAVLVLGVTLCWLCFAISSLLVRRSQAFLAASLFLVLIYGQPLNGTHHWFSVLAVMAAVAILMPARSPGRILVAGVLLGTASFFTQTRGLVAATGVAGFFLWEHFRTPEIWPPLLKRQALLFISFFATLAILSARFSATSGLSQLWYFQVVYVRQYMVSGWTIPSLGLPQTLAWKTLSKLSPFLFVYALLPLVYPLALCKCWQERRNTSPDTQRIVLLALVGLALLTEVALSPNWLRIFCVAMPGIILLLWMLGRTRFYTYAAGLLWAAVLCLASLQVWSRHHQASLTIELPAGKVAITPQTYEKLAWLTQHTQPGQDFFQAAWPGLYLPLGLRNPVYLDVLETGDQTRPQYVDLTISQLNAKQVRYILWSPRLDAPDSFNPPEAYHLTPFRQYLHNQYRRVWTFSDQDEIWERK